MLSRNGSSSRRAAAGWAFATLAGAVAVNSASVAAEQRWHLHTRFFGPWAALAHATLIIPPWIAFLGASRALPKGDLRVPEELASGIGGVLQSGGVLVAILGFKQLGLGALINLDQFRPATEPAASGIYRLVDDPIYTGYALATAGWALRRQSMSGLVLAGLMYALLTRLQSPIEGARDRRAK